MIRLTTKIAIPTFLCLFLGLSLNILISSKSLAVTHVGVAVYVNNTAITNTDILDRAKLTAGELGISYQANADMLLKNAKRALIIENLQIQYAKLNKITITRKDLNDFLQAIVKKLSYKNGVRSFLRAHDVKMKTFRRKAYAKLLWEKVMTVQTKSEIMQDKQRTQQKMLDLSKSKDRYDLSEIVLSFKSDQEKKSTLEFARKLHDKLLANNNQFGTYALKFSQSSTSAFQGNLGLVHVNSLPKSYKQDIINLKVKGISQPIQLDNTIVLFMRNKGTATQPKIAKKVDSVKFYRLIMQAQELQQSGLSSMEELVQKVMNYVLNCGDLDTYAKKLNSKQSGFTPETPINTMSPEYKSLISKLKLAQAQPVKITNGVMIIMICKRGKMTPPSTNKIDIQSIQKEIFTSTFTKNSTDTIDQLYSSAIIGYF